MVRVHRIMDDRKRQYRDTENDKKREQYNALSKEEKSAYHKRTDANKAKRKQKAFDDGRDWCAHGSHAVNKEDMIFCPVDDLGIVGCIPGKTRHHACIRHFSAYIAPHRARNNKTLERKWTDAKSHAKRRGLLWCISNSKERELKETNICHYCGHRSSNELILGIDRMDPDPPAYTDDNVVASCATCNYSKGGWSVSDFISACTAVTNFAKSGACTTKSIPYRQVVRQMSDTPMYHTTASSWMDDETTTYMLGDVEWRKRIVTYDRSMPYYQYKYNAKRRGLEFEISESKYKELITGGCFYCGIKDEDRVGIDRKLSTIGYMVDNCVGCCSTCNFMKKSLTPHAFVDMCTRVHHKWASAKGVEA